MTSTAGSHFSYHSKSIKSSNNCVQSVLNAHNEHVQKQPIELNKVKSPAMANHSNNLVNNRINTCSYAHFKKKPRPFTSIETRKPSMNWIFIFSWLTISCCLSHATAYSLSFCSEQNVQQIFCAHGSMYALHEGRLYTGPSCANFAHNRTLKFDQELYSELRAQSAFIDRGGNLYMFKDNLALVHYNNSMNMEKNLYNLSDLILHFKGPALQYMVYSEYLNAMFAVSKQRPAFHGSKGPFVFAFDNHLYTSRGEVRWGVQNISNFAPKDQYSLEGIPASYFFFAGDQVILKSSLVDTEYGILPGALDCTRDSARNGYNGLVNCIRQELEMQRCRSVHMTVSICTDVKYYFAWFMLLLLLLLLLFICCCCWFCTALRERGRSWNVFRKEEMLARRILKRLNKEERARWLAEGNILEKAAKHKLGTDMNNNSFYPWTNEKPVPVKGFTNPDFPQKHIAPKEKPEKDRLLFGAPKKAPNDVVDSESMLSSIKVDDFKENRPDIDLNDPARPYRVPSRAASEEARSPISNSFKKSKKWLI